MLADNALTTLDRMKLMLGLSDIEDERTNEIVTLLINKASSWIERQIGRHLGKRSYRQFYDADGQRGIPVPNSMEYDAAREIAANMGTSMNGSINISTNAGAQIASDLGKGVIQGVSGYVAKKMRTVKVTLKAGHRLLLHSPEQ